MRMPPDKWIGLSAIPRLHVSHVWIMGREFGLVLTCTDLQLYEAEPRECPFQRTRLFIEPEGEMEQ